MNITAKVQYITVRGTDFDNTDDATFEEDVDSSGTDPEGLDLIDDDETDDGWGGPVSGAPDDTPSDDTNPPRDLTAAVLSHGRHRAWRHEDDEDATPNTLARRIALRTRANNRFIAGGAVIAGLSIKRTGTAPVYSLCG